MAEAGRRRGRVPPRAGKVTAGRSTAQLADWERDGFLVIEGFVDVARCDELIAHTAQIVEQVDRDIVSIFSTQEQTRTSDEWFLSSGDKVRAFFAPAAFEIGRASCRDRVFTYV